MDRWNDDSMSPAYGPLRVPLRALCCAALTIAACLAVLALSTAPAARAQGTQAAPGSVQSALDVLSRVVAESGEMIAAHRYGELPRESDEFEAGLTALEKTLGSRPSTLRTKLEPLIGKARIASSAMSEAVKARRDSMLPLAHRQLADAVRDIIDSFPPELRPAPGSGS